MNEDTFEIFRKVRYSKRNVYTYLSELFLYIGIVMLVLVLNYVSTLLIKLTENGLLRVRGFFLSDNFNRRHHGFS